MILQSYVKWTSQRSDFDNLSLFLTEFFKGKTDRQCFEHIMFEIHNMAIVLGEMEKRICALERVKKTESKTEKPKAKKNVND